VAKIKIVDLPKDYKITQEEMARILGGGILSRSYKLYSPMIQGPLLSEFPCPTAGGSWTNYERSEDGGGIR
jgi:hypothetical protein